MTLPRSRWVQALILLLTCAVMAAFPLVNHFRNTGVNADTAWFGEELAGRRAEAGGTTVGRNKDYPLWYATGRAFMSGDDYYPPAAGTVFPFMYPPFAALLLGLLSELGPDVALVVLVLLNVVSLAVAVELSVRLAAGTADVSLWVRVIPATICLFFVNDMFLLGQPNLGLLCLVLGGLMLVRSGRGVGGGGLLAAAAAIKAFPAVVLVYLVWRRQWVAAAAMVAFTALFLVPLPATVRGWDRSVTELKRWADGMLFKQGESGFGQRPEQSLGWRNQSVFGVGHRLLRPVNAEADNFDWPPKSVFVNVVTLTHRQALAGIVGFAGLLGLGFVSVMPARRRRTRESDALEIGILTVLVIVCTPYTFSYYFVWLIFPLTALVWHGLTGRTPTARRIAWGAVGVTTAGFALSAPLTESRLMMAYGAQFWAALAAAAGCGWLLWRDREAS